MKILERIKNYIAIIIYAILTWFWFDLNHSNSLPLIGHTELVYGWCSPYADKVGLIFDLIYFSFSVAFCIVITDILLNKLPFMKLIGSESDRKEMLSAGTASLFVNFIVLLYEFHVENFKIKLIGLTIGLIICWCIGFVLSWKIIKIVRPLLGIADLAESVNEINNNDKQ